MFQVTLRIRMRHIQLRTAVILIYTGWSLWLTPLFSSCLVKSMVNFSVHRSGHVGCSLCLTSLNISCWEKSVVNFSVLVMLGEVCCLLLWTSCWVKSVVIFFSVQVMLGEYCYVFSTRHAGRIWETIAINKFQRLTFDLSAHIGVPSIY